jgi:hypothetical protein
MSIRGPTLWIPNQTAWGTSEKRTYILSATSAAYRYYRLRVTAGNTSGDYAIGAFQAYGPLAYNNMTLVTTAQTADSSVNTARVLIEYDNTAAPTLNTDLTVEVTCDGGTNWAGASLSSVSTNGQGGRKVAETLDQACTAAGTSFAARIKTFNNKNIPIYGVSLTVH